MQRFKTRPLVAQACFTTLQGKLQPLCFSLLVITELVIENLELKKKNQSILQQVEPNISCLSYYVYLPQATPFTYFRTFQCSK